MIIRTVIVDDHTSLRKMLRILLERCPDVEVVGEAANGEEAVRCCRDLRPDVVTIDVHMPVLDGFEAVQKIRSEFSSIKILAVSSDLQEASIERMLAAGASGYVLKDFLHEELVFAAETVAQGRAFLGRRVVDSLLRVVNDTGNALVESEANILRHLAQGVPRREIALSLKLPRDQFEGILKSANDKAAGSAIGDLIKRIGIE